MTGEQFVAGSIVAVILSVAMFNVGSASGISDLRKQAVESGAGEYRADPRTGQTRFVFFPRPTTAPVVEKGL